MWRKAGKLPLGPVDVGVYGWSGGYVALEQTGGSDDEGNDTPVVIRASASADGLSWSAPVTLETGFNGSFRIESIVEGPHGLLALGYPYGDTCGGPEHLFAMWASPDGRAWERLAMPNGFLAGWVASIVGGRAGYIALGTREDGKTQAIWTSQEGRGWRSRPLPTVSSGTLALDSAASFDGGFVVVGSVLGEEGCGGAQHIHYATWFSADGASWTRGSLPGASTDKNQSLIVHSSGDRVTVAQIPPGDAPTARIWTSADGNTWTPAGTVSTDLVWGSVSDGHHTVLIIRPDSGIGLPTITGLGADGRSTPITQSKQGPAASEDDPQYEFAIGPTGLLAVRADGEAAWLGVPS